MSLFDRVRRVFGSHSDVAATTPSAPSTPPAATTPSVSIAAPPTPQPSGLDVPDGMGPDKDPGVPIRSGVGWGTAPGGGPGTLDTSSTSEEPPATHRAEIGETITIDGTIIGWSEAALNAVLGDARVDGQWRFWDDWGIEAMVRDAELASITFVLAREARSALRGPDQHPASLWQGEILVDGQPFFEVDRPGSRVAKEGARVPAVGFNVEVTRPSTSPTGVYTDPNNWSWAEALTVTVEPLLPSRGVDPQVYAIPECSEPVIQFTNWTFKLAIVQDLMYFDKTLKPEFNIYDFADTYTKRRIDPDWEGIMIGLIPEAMDWFWRLPVPVRLTQSCTTLSGLQESTIVLQVWPQWDGESAEFDLVISPEELDQFPQMRTLDDPMGIAPQTLQLLADRGWDIGESGRKLLDEQIATRALFASIQGRPHTFDEYCRTCSKTVTVTGLPELEPHRNTSIRVWGNCPTCGRSLVDRIRV